MKKIIFVTRLDGATTGMLTDENFEPLLFIAVNKVEGSDNYAVMTNGGSVGNGRTFIDAYSALQDAKDMYGADKILPISEKQLKSWFGKDYTEKRKDYKEGLSQAKREERERKKLAEESKKGRVNQLWLKSHGGKGYWN